MVAIVFWLRFLILILPFCIFADDASCTGLDIFEQLVSGCSNVSIFEPSDFDLSLTFLRMIFGSVGNSLYGMSNPLVGTMFRIFNTGVLLVTSALITYTVFLTVMSGSQDGSSMGGNNKGMLNPWVVARIVGGASLLIPSFSGYSGMQVIVMYIVVQGIGFADTIWTASLKYIASTGNSVISTPVSNSSSNLIMLANTNGMMDNLYLSSLCASANSMLSESSCSSNPSMCEAAYSLSPAYDMVTVTFPFSCGVYNINVTDITSTQDSSVNQRYAMMMKSALQQAVGILQSSALSSMQSVSSILTSYPNDSYYSVLPNLSSAGCSSNYCVASSAYAGAASSYLEVVNYIYQVLHPPENLAENVNWTDPASGRGWVSAGMYYFDLAKNYTTGVGSYSSNSPAQGVLLTANGPFIATGSAVASPYAPADSTMIYPMQIMDAYYFNVQQSVCSAGCTETPLAECNSCQAIGLIENISSPMLLSNGTETAASVQADSMYSNLVYKVFSLLRQIDTYNYCDLIPVGTAAGWIGLQPCNMVMPIARFNRLVLGGSMRVLMGLNVGWWNAASSSVGNCSAAWNGSLINTVTNIMGNGASSRAGMCLRAANSCLKDKSLCSASKIYEPCMSGMYGFFPFLYNLSNGGYMDPVFSASKMGMQMMSIAVNYWQTVTQDVFGSVMTASWSLFGISIPIQIAGDVAAGGLYGYAPVGGLVYSLAQVAVNIMKMFFEMSKAVIEMYLPLGASLATIIFAMGTMLGIYLPFMPFMLYLFGVIGWVMAVIEAMVAAPLVALGVTHPEGHDLLGKSEQAVMLLLGVFIRPATMIMGLLFAMNLAKVAVQLLDYGFLFVFTEIGNMNSAGSDGITNAFIMLGAMTVYVYVLMTIIDQSYSLIYQVPDKILRWIGGPQDSSSTAQMANQVKGQIQQVGGKAGDAGSGVASRTPGMGGITASGSKYGGKKKEEGPGQAKGEAKAAAAAAAGGSSGDQSKDKKEANQESAAEAKGSNARGSEVNLNNEEKQ